MSCLLKQFQDKMLQWKTLAKKNLNVFWFKVWDFNISDVIYEIRNLNKWHFSPPVITHLNYTCLSSWALVIFAILSNKCFPKERFTA